MAASAYYFFAASLPPLAFGQPPALDIETFRGQCGELLSPPDARAVEIVLGGDGDAEHPFVKEWLAFERSLVGALAAARAAALGREHSAATDVPEPADVRLVAEVMRLDSPLERERRLDEHRWARATDMAAWDAFSAELILAYAVHLVIATRWAAFDEKKGAARFDAAVAKKSAEALSLHLEATKSTEELA